MIEELINGRLLLRSNHLGRDALDKLLRMRQEGVLVDVTVRAGDRCEKIFFFSFCGKLMCFIRIFL